jgi:SsrA-binding protein
MAYASGLHLPLPSTMASSRFSSNLSVQNKKAYFDYHILETWQAGIVLRGTEIKSIRESKFNLQDAYAQIRNGELYLVNLHVGLYEQGTYNNHEVRRERKLLLKKRELKRVEKGASEQGITIVPTKIYINDRGLCKIEIGLAKGKKSHDKRDTIKERDISREQRFQE